MIDEKLLAILACPACQGDVTLGTEQQGKAILRSPSSCVQGDQGSPHQIVCTKCGRKYPIKNGIPVLLVDEAKT